MRGFLNDSQEYLIVSLAGQLDSQRNLHLQLILSWVAYSFSHKFSFTLILFSMISVFKLVLRSFFGLVEYENVSYFQHSIISTKSERQQAFCYFDDKVPHTAPTNECKVCVISKDLLSKLNYKEHINIKFA